MMYDADLKDDPVIRCMERTGNPPWEREEEQAVCPVCGEECETAYYDRYGDVMGCDCCLHRGDPYKDHRFLPREMEKVYAW